MNISDKQKTAGLMFLSMLFGGVLVHLMGFSNTQSVPASAQNVAAASMPMVSNKGAMPAGHPSVGANTEKTAAPVATQVGSIDDLVVGLRNRLEANPKDVKGWVLLAKSYQHLGQWPAAQNAAGKARELGYDGEILSTSTGTENPHAMGSGQSKDYVNDYFEPKNSLEPASNK